MKPHISKNQRIWVKSKKGNVYVCPAGSLLDPENASERELQQHCLDDSRRPDNY